MSELSSMMGMFTKATSGPGESPMLYQPASMGAEYSSTGLSAVMGQSSNDGELATRGLHINYTPGGGGLPQPGDSTPASRSSSERVRDLNLPPAPDSSAPTAPTDSDAGLKRLQMGLNLANSIAGLSRGLYGDLSSGPGASPLMRSSVGGGMPYQPSARNRPMTLSELLARR